MRTLPFYLAVLFLFPLIASGQARFDRVDVDNIRLDGNTISTTNTNGNLTIDLNGTGATIFNDLTASRVLYLDNSKHLSSSTTNFTELQFVGGVTDSLCGNTQSCILTNKTLDSDSNSFSNIKNADIKAAAGIALNKLAATTVSRAIVSDASGFLTPSTTTAAEILQVNGVTSSLCGINQSCTLTSKTLTSPAINGANFNFGTASNSNRLLLPSDTTTNLSGYTNTNGLLAYDTTQSKPVYNNGSAWVAVGSGSGGDTNYIGNPDAESGVTGWSTYADAAGVSPVDCTGGSPSSTWAQSTDATLTGSANFLWTKSANNRQGEGVAYAFTIDAAQKAKVLQVEFDYRVDSGTFVAGSSGVDSDQEIYIYDVTNAVLIQPSTYKLFSSTTSPPAHFVASFQSASNSTSYRLCVHTATTSASAYTTRYDSFKVSPSKYIYGSPITDQISYTPTITHNSGGITNHTVTGYWNRVGDKMHVHGHIVFTGTPANFNGIIATIPTGFTIDTTKALGSSADTVHFGTSEFLDSGASIWNGIITLNNSTTVKVSVGGTSIGRSIDVVQNVPFTFGTGDSMDWDFTVPITGWSSSVQMSDSADSRVIAAKFSGSSISGTSGAAIVMGTVAYDTHGAYNSSTGEYTVKVPGKYNIKVSSAKATTGSTVTVYKNGSSETSLFSWAVATGWSSGSTSSDYIAGDLITIRSDFTGTIASMIASIERVSGPQTIGATETVAAKATTASTQSLTGNTTDIVYGTIVRDTHGAMNTSSGAYKTPIGGWYQVSLSMVVGTANITPAIYVNATRTAWLGNATGSSKVTNGATLIFLNAGDLVTVRADNNCSLVSDATANQFSIFRVGL